MVWVEQPFDMPTLHWVEGMEENHDVVHARFPTEEIGGSASRPRFMGFAALKETLVWVGPKGDCTEDFLRTFKRKAVVDAQSFAMMDTPEEIESMRKWFAAKKGVEYEPSLKTRDIVCESAGRFLDKAKVLRAAGKKVGRDGVMVCDISQDPDKRFRAGGFFPSQQKSSSMALVSGVDTDLLDDHLFTAGELSLKEGFPSLDKWCPPELVECLNFRIQDAPKPVQFRLLGDGMSLTAVIAWQLYCLSNTIRREQIRVMRPITQLNSPSIPLRGAAPDGDGDDD